MLLVLEFDCCCRDVCVCVSALRDLCVIVCLPHCCVFCAHTVCIVGARGGVCHCDWFNVRVDPVVRVYRFLCECAFVRFCVCCVCMCFSMYV